MNNFEINIEMLLTMLNETLKKKNKDYGDSYVKSVERFGEWVILVRLMDKFNRLEQLIQNKEQKVDESIEDTLLDLAGYCILELERRGRHKWIAF